MLHVQVLLCLFACVPHEVRSLDVTAELIRCVSLPQVSKLMGIHKNYGDDDVTKLSTLAADKKEETEDASAERQGLLATPGLVGLGEVPGTVAPGVCYAYGAMVGSRLVLYGDSSGCFYVYDWCVSQMQCNVCR